MNESASEVDPLFEGYQAHQKMNSLIEEVLDDVGEHECARGYLRYEKMRTLNLRALHELHDRNMQGEKMDDMIDDIILDGWNYFNEN